MAVVCEAPAFLTTKDRVPLEVALELIEGEVSRSEFVDREILREKGVQTGAPEILWWIDHTLSMLLSHRHIRRERDDHGKLGYSATPIWEEREELLKDLRPPVPRDRSARRLARQLASQERRRLMRATSGRP